ncbi:putative T7SS-secreted protein [Streptomyces sp. NPDC057623]|uniref:putative T7SS-secreted protein n=1 Tax=Streptomyces sp. NPDC057623 TaxID=3346187 RepID=UPI0036C3034C
MAAQLGSTRDPRALIPGNPSKLTGDADKLDGHAKTLDGIGDELGSVRISSWHGQASDAFWDDFSGQKQKWFRGSDSLGAAAGALRDYARALSWAQGQAEEAIRLYDGGDESGGEQLLASARAHVESEGDAAAEKFKAQGGEGDNAPDWLFWASEAAQDDTGATSKQLFELERAGDPRTIGAWGDHKNMTQAEREALREGKGPGITVAGPSVSADAKVWGAEAKGRGEFAGGEVSGKAGVNLLGVDASAGVGLVDGNATAQASGKAYLAQATAEGKYGVGYFEASGKGEAYVGAEAGVKGSIGTDGVHVGGEAFAGAKATAEGHASVAGVGVGGTAEAWAGAGAEAHFDAGMKDGKIVIGGDLGVGLGIGGKLGGQIELDPGKITDAAGDAVDAIGDWFD